MGILARSGLVASTLSLLSFSVMVYGGETNTPEHASKSQLGKSPVLEHLDAQIHADHPCRAALSVYQQHFPSCREKHSDEREPVIACLQMFEDRIGFIFPQCNDFIVKMNKENIKYYKSLKAPKNLNLQGEQAKVNLDSNAK